MMKQENKQLLIQDICARLPYKVIGAVEHYDEIDNSPVDFLGVLQGFDNNSKAIKFVYLPEYTDDIGAYNWFSYIRFKPFLRSMSSMTAEEKEELRVKNIIIGVSTSGTIETTIQGVDWLNKHHFDYRGLIPKDLAIAVTEENNPYEN